MTGWNMDQVIVISGLLTMVYTLKGGFEAVVWTDVMQGIIIWTGIFICLGYLLFLPPGGPAAVFETACRKPQDHLRQHGLRSLAAHGLGADHLRLLLVPAALHRRPDAGAALPVGEVRSGGGPRRGAGRAAVGAGLDAVHADRHVHLDLSTGSPGEKLPAYITKGDQVFPYFLSTHLPPGIVGARDGRADRRRRCARCRAI